MKIQSIVFTTDSNTRSEPQFKFVIVGDSSVGKSSLLAKIIDNRFTDNTVPTVGVDFVRTNIFINF
jgi:GTPase SAR1 family protein